MNREVALMKRGQLVKSKSDDECVEKRKNRLSERALSSLSFNFKRSISKPDGQRDVKNNEKSLASPQNTSKLFMWRLLNEFKPGFKQRTENSGPQTAPLVVEDPPSSENDSDLDHVKGFPHPTLLNGSSGNFAGVGGPRSAPTTPQGMLGSSPGSLCGEPLATLCTSAYISSIPHSSPNHSLFTKYDKGALKQLSTSTPAMTAQAQSPDPPSPKPSKEDKHSITKARQKKFHRHFPTVDDDEKVLNYYSCALVGDILLQGHLYITKNYFAFYSNVFGYVTKLLIPMLTVEKITKEKTARIIPNAVGIITAEEKHVFGTLMSRDNTYRYMNKVLEAARTASQIPVEPEILERIEPSETDSTETREDESGRDTPNCENQCRKTSFKRNELLKNDSILPKSKEKFPIASLRYINLASLPRHNMLLLATTLLLVLLFLSAAVLLYRISKVQDKFSMAFQENRQGKDGEDIYSELLHWQSTLHTKSAGAVNSFLDSNLDQIAKVRQSLEALSALLLPNEGKDEREKQPNS